MESSCSLPSASNSTINIKISSIVDGKMFQLLEEKSDADHIVALCLKCLPRRVEIKGHSNSSSNYLSHLRRIHGEKAVKEYKSHLVKAKTSGKKLPKKQLTQEKFDSNILKFVIHSMVDLSVVDDPYFKRIFDDLNISELGVNVSNRHSLSRKMDALFCSNNELLKEKLRSLNFVCTTVDIWSGRRRSFLGITVQWIEENTLERRSAAIACRRLRSSYTCDKIAELISEIYREFGLYIPKVRATTTDNGSNFLKAFNDYGVTDSCVEYVNFEDRVFDDLDNEFDNDDFIPENSWSDEGVSAHVEFPMILPQHITCCTQTLNLCCSADISDTIRADENLWSIHERVMTKCNLLWRAASSPKTAEVLEELLGHTLKRPSETRWNSLYDALKQIIELGAKCEEVFHALKLKTNFSEDELSYIEEHLTVTEPVARALGILHTEHQTYYGSIIPVILSLRSKLENILHRELKYCRPILLSLLNSVQSRFQEFIECSTTQYIDAAIASISHPQFKDHWFTLIPEGQRINLMKSFKEAVSTELTPIKVEKPENEDALDSDFFVFGNELNSTTREPDVQIVQFLRDQRQALGMLESYPEVRKVFVKYNTPLPSSAPVERLFSYAMMKNLPKWNRLSDTRFESRVILKANVHLLFNNN